MDPDQIIGNVPFFRYLKLCNGCPEERLVKYMFLGPFFFDPDAKDGEPALYRASPNRRIPICMTQPVMTEIESVNLMIHADRLLEAAYHAFKYLVELESRIQDFEERNPQHTTPISHPYGPLDGLYKVLSLLARPIDMRRFNDTIDLSDEEVAPPST